MSQQHLDRKTVLNIVYTQQATRMADAYETLLADFSQMTAWGRGLESDLSHARVEISFLKAEVEMTKAWSAREPYPSTLYQRMAEENTRLKDEVRRLRLIQDGEYEVVIAPFKKQIADLKAENELLRKAGNEFAEAAGLSGCSECFGLYDRLEDAITAWNAAKEGKPSV